MDNPKNLNTYSLSMSNMMCLFLMGMNANFYYHNAKTFDAIAHEAFGDDLRHQNRQLAYYPHLYCHQEYKGGSAKQQQPQATAKRLFSIVGHQFSTFMGILDMFGADKPKNSENLQP